MHRLTDTGGSDATPIDHNASKTVRMRASHLFMRLPRDSFAEMRHNLTTKARSMSRRKIPKFHRKNKYRNLKPSKEEIIEDIMQENQPLLPRNENSSRSVASRLVNNRQPHVIEPQDSQDSTDGVDSDYPEPEISEQPDQYLWVGQDYVNIIKKDHTDVSQPFDMVIDRKTTPRMPWHDVSSVVYGTCARDVARHFIQRWNMIRTVYKSKKFGLYRVKNSYPLLIPKSTANVTLQSLKRLHVEKDAFQATCQVVRSIGSWSGGFSENIRERSIYEAYINAIDSAEHFIFIENQFLVSSTSYGGITLFNQVVSKIEAKIVQAFNNAAKPKFRVFIILPLVPGFPGQIGQTGGAVPQKIQNWMYRTLCQGEDSLFGRLAAKRVPVHDYLSVRIEYFQ